MGCTCPQIPKPPPLARIKLQSARSWALGAACVSGVVLVPAAGPSEVVSADDGAPGAVAAQAPPTGSDADTLSTMLVGVTGVIGLLMRSFRAERKYGWDGLTRLEQHAIMF